MRRDARPFLSGLAVAALVATALLAYPLWVIFAGPGSYHGLPGGIRAYGADLASFVAYSVVGMLLALGCRRVLDLAVTAGPRTGPVLRWGAVVTLVMALLPIAPTPLPTRTVPPTPPFVASGAWRPYAEGGRSVVPLPLPGSRYPDPLRWAAETGLELRLPRGYFLGPDRDPDSPGDRTARYSAVPRPTDRFLDRVHRTGQVPAVDARLRAAAVEDLRFWRAGVVLLAPQPREDALRRGMVALTGLEPERIGGVWVWDIRPLTS